MEQLNELEKRVLGVIERNKGLQAEVTDLKNENARLQGQCKQLEASLMSRSQSEDALKAEKTSIKTTIEELLNAINTLEAKQKTS